MASSGPVSLLVSIRRHWLLVLALAIVAAAAAGGVTALRDVTYTATAVIALDNSALARTPGLPGGERILVELRTAEYYEAVARASDSTPETVKAGLTSFAEGQPMERIKITFTGPAEDEARTITEAAASVAMDRIEALSEVERERQEQTVTAAKAAIAQFDEDSSGDTAWERADSAYKLFALNNSLATAEYTLGVIDSAHTLEDGVTVTQTSILRSIVTNGAGGAVIGLVIGIGIAYLRERSVRSA